MVMVSHRERLAAAEERSAMAAARGRGCTCDWGSLRRQQKWVESCLNTDEEFSRLGEEKNRVLGKISVEVED